MFSEPAVICHKRCLATEAMGLAGWMHCGFLSLEVMRALGFRMVGGAYQHAYANPVGLDGVLEGFCPPYFPSMDAAVDAALAHISRGRASETQPYTMPPSKHRAAIPRAPSDAGLACAKAVCRYIHDTYGRFTTSVDTMHLTSFTQAP